MKIVPKITKEEVKDENVEKTPSKMMTHNKVIDAYFTLDEIPKENSKQKEMAIVIYLI